MHENRSLQKPRSALSALSALSSLAAAIACGAASTDTALGSETHFLARCTAACGGGLECLDGVCTRECSADSECTALSIAATCSADSSASRTARCGVSCDADADCLAQNDTSSCEAASCVGSAALFSSTAPVSAASCPTFAGGVQQPSDAQTTFEPVPGATNVEWAYADESGLYWIDTDGAVFGRKKGATSTTALRPAPSNPGTRLGLMADADRLYWTEAGAYPPGPLEPSPPPPPGRLLSISKDGGAAELLVESPSVALRPLGVGPAGSVFVATTDGELNEVTASGVLERVANVPRDESGSLQMVDGQVHWLANEPQNDQTISVLFTAIPGRGEPVRVQPIEGTFLAGRGVVFWAPEEYRSEELLLVQHYMMLNENTGCLQPLPSVELSIGQSLVDRRHIYWQSFNKLGSSTDGQPEDLAPILRVDLRTGRFERVTTPGLDVTVTSDLAAQDAETLYVKQSPGEVLLAVRKPD